MNTQALADCARCVRSASRMSSGDSTSRACCIARSIQRARPGTAGAANTAAVTARLCARSRSRSRSGAAPAVAASACSAAAQATCSPSSAAPKPGRRAHSSQRSLRLPRASPAGSATASRSSRAARSQAAAISGQACRPRACCRPAASRSRAKSSSWALPSTVPRNCTPASASWCASSNTATSTLGSSSAMPVSRSAMSAKNRWWLTTTTSAAIASRRAFMTWQARNSGQSAPRQLSRVEVTSGITAERSSRPAISARSPEVLDRAHCSTLASIRSAWRSMGLVASDIRLPRLSEPVQAQIAGAALQQRQRHRQPQCLDQPRQVAQVELVLQALRRGADQRAGARQQRRHQIGVGLADAGAGLDDQRLAALDGLRHRHRHALLHVALDIARIDLRQRAAGAEGLRDSGLQFAFGNGCRSGSHHRIGDCRHRRFKRVRADRAVLRGGRCSRAAIGDASSGDAARARRRHARRSCGR